MDRTSNRGGHAVGDGARATGRATSCRRTPPGAAGLAVTGPALTWLVLADAVMVGAFALADLTTHEVTTERVVH